MKNKEVASYGANILSAIFTGIQTDEIFQIVNLVLTILATIFSISFTIYNWYRKAKEDGKITKEEVDELIDDLKNKKEK